MSHSLKLIPQLIPFLHPHNRGLCRPVDEALLHRFHYSGGGHHVYTGRGISIVTVSVHSV